MAAPHQQDGSDTIPTRNKSKLKNEPEFLSWDKTRVSQEPA
jgi:hypothetical protein